MKAIGSVYARLFLYTSIAFLTSFVAEFSSLTWEDLKSIDPMQWVVKAGSMILSILVTWRAFIDQSITTFNDPGEVDRSDNI